MQYKGIKLVEMIRKNWDGRSREMLVWDDESLSPYKEIVVGYNPGDNYWMANDGYYWHHCAEIPTEGKEDVMKLLNDNENEILELRQENDDLKARIKSLSVERGKMANAVSGAVWKELMTRAKNNNDLIIITPEGGPGKVGFGFNDIADLVRKKIIDYESENPSEKKVRRMTYKELSEWLKEGKGVCKMGYLSNKISYPPSMKDDEVKEGILISAFGSSNFEEPLIEEE